MWFLVFSIIVILTEKSMLSKVDRMFFSSVSLNPISFVVQLYAQSLSKEIVIKCIFLRPKVCLERSNDFLTMFFYFLDPLNRVRIYLNCFMIFWEL